MWWTVMWSEAKALIASKRERWAFYVTAITPDLVFADTLAENMPSNPWLAYPLLFLVGATWGAVYLIIWLVFISPWIERYRVRRAIRNTPAEDRPEWTEYRNVE
jgi:hypothetical protein